MDEKGLSDLMDSIDSDGSGSIDYTEFIASALDRKVFAQSEIVQLYAFCWQLHRIS